MRVQLGVYGPALAARTHRTIGQHTDIGTRSFTGHRVGPDRDSLQLVDGARTGVLAVEACHSSLATTDAPRSFAPGGQWGGNCDQPPTVRAVWRFEPPDGPKRILLCDQHAAELAGHERLTLNH